MVAVAAVGIALALIAYRETLPGLDEHDGFVEGLVILAVDAGMMLGVPAVALILCVAWSARQLFGRLGIRSDSELHRPE
jgi:hypothetical protein